jgi:hypothetical protein
MRNSIVKKIIFTLSKAAITIVDQQHSDHIKRLNSIKHENAVKQKQIEEYQTRYDQIVKDAEEAIKTDAGESETAVVSFF